MPLLLYRRLVMSGKGKDSSSSSSTNNSLDEIEALLKEQFYDFSKKLISIKEKFDTVHCCPTIHK